MPPDLGVEIHATGGEAAGFQNFMHRQRDLRHVHGELIGIPPRLIVTAIDVDGAEDTQRRGQRDLVLEGVAGQHRMVLLDVELDIVLQAHRRDGVVTGGDIVIILMLGGLLRLGLQQDRTLEADLVLVLDDQ